MKDVSRRWACRTAGTDWRVAAATAVGVAAALLAGSASSAWSVAAVPGSAPGLRAADSRHIVAISIDGLNPNALRRLGVARAPAMHRMLAEGSGTLNARTAYERTETLPNHAGMLTGRRVAKAAGHHVNFNYDNGSDVHTEAGKYVPSLFDVVHNRGGRTELYAGKEKFAFFDRSWGGALGAPDTVGVDNGRDKIDRYYLDTALDLTQRLVRRTQRDPAEAAFLHIALPDVLGHRYGFMGKRYLNGVERSDRLVGKVLRAVHNDPFLRGHVVVVLTADHGGSAESHADPAKLANYRVPFLAWGAGVARGADLYRVNPGRTDPGTGRPGYADPPPIRNTDLASLVTTLLGHPAVPGGLLPNTAALKVS